MSRTSVGFVGLGLMGKPMARRFLAAGYPLAVSSRSRPPVDEIAAEGARACGSPAEVAAHSEVVFTMLPDAPNLKDVVYAENGLLNAMKPGGVLVDCTSNDPAFSAEVAEALSAKEVGMLDAPVSGAPEGAAGGTLAIMAGGPRDVFARCKPLLDVLGGRWCTWARRRVQGASPSSRTRFSWPSLSWAWARRSCSVPRPVSTPRRSWT